MSQDSERARSYFDRLAPEYDRAFRRQGRTPLGALVNRAFRSATFELRMRRLESLLADRGLAGKSVLDLGCGSGQVSLLAASLGARVRGVDISPRMLEIARESASRAGLAASTSFEEGDVTSAALEPADAVLLIGVVEYYEELSAVMARAAAAAREALIVGHTSRVWYRMLLRRLLFSLDGSSLYFHPMRDVVAAGEAAGLRLARRLDEHAFSLLVFERVG